MNKRNNDGGLDDLYMMKYKTVEEISECSSGLDDAAKKRIAKLCEKKMEASKNPALNDKDEKIAEVKKYKSPKWYRAAIASAACLAVVASVLLLKNSIKISDPNAKDTVVTSQTEETTQTSVSQTNGNTEIDKQVTDEHQDQTDEMSYKYDFNLNVEKISAKDIYECSQPYTMPETINGYQNYYISALRDKESVYVGLQSPETNQEQIGVYNFVNNTCSAISDIKLSDIVVCYSEDYLIILSDCDPADDENTPVLSYYDVKKNTSGIIYNDMWKEQRYSNELTQNSYIMYNNCLYFNVYTQNQDGYKDSDIYKYNFSDNDLTLVRENASGPMIINNSVAALIEDSETGWYDTIQTIEGDNKFSYDIEDRTFSLCAANNEIYEIYDILSPDGNIKAVKEVKSQNTLFSSYPDGRCIVLSDSSDDIIGFNDLDRTEIQTPFVYDINRNKIVEFDHLSKSNHFVYVKDNYGLISSFDFSDDGKEKQLIFFQSKP